MSTAADEELRVLRARAYGPMADIEDDPAALRRLQQLEAMQKPDASAPRPVPDRASVPEVVPAPLTAPPPLAGPVSLTGPSGEAGAPESDAGRAHDDVFRALGLPESPSPQSRSTEVGEREPSERVSSWFTARATRILWVLAIVAAAAVAAVATYALVKITPVAASSGAPQIATLEPASTLDVPTGWMGVGPSSRVFDFYGLTIVETAGGYSGGSAGTNCLTVVREDQVPKKGEYDDASGWSFDGPVYSGCGVGVFSATVELPIDSSVPKELKERFPAGKALQFVFDGDRVGVFLDSE